MIISIRLQIYKITLFYPKFFLYFRPKGIIFPSTRLLFGLTWLEREQTLSLLIKHHCGTPATSSGVSRIGIVHGHFHSRKWSAQHYQKANFRYLRAAFGALMLAVPSPSVRSLSMRAVTSPMLMLPSALTSAQTVQISTFSLSRR